MDLKSLLQTRVSKHNNMVTEISQLTPAANSSSLPLRGQTETETVSVCSNTWRFCVNCCREEATKKITNWTVVQSTEGVFFLLLFFLLTGTVYSRSKFNKVWDEPWTLSWWTLRWETPEQQIWVSSINTMYVLSDLKKKKGPTSPHWR